MATISCTLRRIKQDLEPFLPQSSILRACEAVGHHGRNRQFDPVVSLHRFVLQILCFNTSMTHLRHLAKIPMSAAAYCKARMRVTRVSAGGVEGEVAGGESGLGGRWV
jgi:hypothetical protein